MQALYGTPDTFFWPNICPMVVLKTCTARLKEEDLLKNQVKSTRNWAGDPNILTARFIYMSHPETKIA